MRGASERFFMQSRAYAFPYHYLADVAPDGTISICRQLVWGLEYMTYMTWARDRILHIQPRNLLDVGCGDGRLCSLLGPLAEQYVGVDLSEQAIAFARAFNPRAEFVVGSASDAPGTFDVVACIEVLEHIPDQDLAGFVASLHEKVASHGILLVSVPTIVRPVKPKHYLELLREHLAPYFDIVSHVYLFQWGYQTALLNRLLSNRWFILHWRGLRRWIWKVHCAKYFYAQLTNGLHLAVWLQARS
jgi:2-polyprenyl-3-methyl-5-hydroxy-6-metoxy-1,4-benzoquinol methylase